MNLKPVKKVDVSSVFLSLVSQYEKKIFGVNVYNIHVHICFDTQIMSTN